MLQSVHSTVRRASQDAAAASGSMQTNVILPPDSKQGSVMKLIGSFASPFVRKARIVLAEKKIDYQLVLENVWVPETTIHTFNPLGTRA
jgi:hypothetical protein